MLVQSESEKLKEREVKHNSELKEWKESLAPRKRVRHLMCNEHVTSVTNNIWILSMLCWCSC